MMEKYRELQKTYHFTIVDANHSVDVVHAILKKEVQKLLSNRKTTHS